ncbi:MAG: LytTR family transcriptional regulator DNA-binding domain-containing protein [Butyrivibrio sp.]|nr:LytTR family transcriptional regulator DNA-binding domain-containing protein [Butyrivibrio sp.]
MEFLERTGRDATLVLRESFPDCPLLLMVDGSVSPREYVKPDIMPSGIIIKPTNDNQIRQSLKEFMDAVLTGDGQDDADGMRVETREGVTRIPFDRILYIEACAKKVYVRTRKEEYGYYDTLDSLEEKLPEFFARCHRGYIVNLHRISKFVGADNLIYLDDGSELPVSRSYKRTIREALK